VLPLANSSLLLTFQLLALVQCFAEKVRGFQATYLHFRAPSPPRGASPPKAAYLLATGSWMTTWERREAANPTYQPSTHPLYKGLPLRPLTAVSSEAQGIRLCQIIHPSSIHPSIHPSVVLLPPLLLPSCCPR